MQHSEYVLLIFPGLPCPIDLYLQDGAAERLRNETDEDGNDTSLYCIVHYTQAYTHSRSVLIPILAVLSINVQYMCFIMRHQILGKCVPSEIRQHSVHLTHTGYTVLIPLLSGIQSRVYSMIYYGLILHTSTVVGGDASGFRGDIDYLKKLKFVTCWNRHEY